MKRLRRVFLGILLLAVPFGCGVWAASSRVSQPAAVQLLQSFRPRDHSITVSPGDQFGREEGYVLDERQHAALTQALARENGIWRPHMRKRPLDGATMLELGDDRSGKYMIRMEENFQPDGGGRQWFVGVSEMRRLSAFEKAARWCKQTLGI